MQQNHNLWQKLVLLTLPCHFSTFSKLQNSKKEKLTVPKTKEKIHVNINSANRETESIEEALLLAIITTIEKSEIFPNIAEEFNKRKNQDNAHFNCLLMLKLAKQYLWKQKYNSPQSIENAFDMHNTSVKLEFFFKVRKINTVSGDDIAAMNEFLKQQKSSDFDVDKFGTQFEQFMGKFDKQTVVILYNEIEFLPNIAHRKVPNEYKEAQQLIKHHRYFIFAREPKANGSYVYYIIEGLQEGKEVSLSEFEVIEQNRLFYLWLMNILKQNDIQINGIHIMKYVDDVVAATIFRA